MNVIILGYNFVVFFYFSYFLAQIIAEIHQLKINLNQFNNIEFVVISLPNY
jgi:hypothetical protein